MTRLTDAERDALSKKVAKKNDDTAKRPRFVTWPFDVCPVCEYFRCRCND
jgi:hypothetical protein